MVQVPDKAKLDAARTYAADFEGQNMQDILKVPMWRTGPKRPKWQDRSLCCALSRYCGCSTPRSCAVHSEADCVHRYQRMTSDQDSLRKQLDRMAAAMGEKDSDDEQASGL
eukprot:669337-Amphidinium_carterae.1